MKNEFKVKSISEKVEVLEVNGQDSRVSHNCLNNCVRYIWEGYSSSKQPSCKKTPWRDAYRDLTK